MAAGFAAEYSELVLQADEVKTAGVQECRGAHIIVDGVILDLKGDRSGVVVGLAVVVHRDDAGLDGWS